MDKDAMIMRAGPGANPETRVRYAAAQVSAGNSGRKRSSAPFPAEANQQPV
jgi:hypothetical protein